MNFKTPRIEDEFNGTATGGIVLDKRLRGILSEAHDWLINKGLPGIMVTCLIRTPEENAAQPGSNPKSSHISGRAADIRTVSYSKESIDALCEHLQDVWGKQFLHVLYHDSGGGPHIHLNINYFFARNW